MLIVYFLFFVYSLVIFKNINWTLFNIFYSIIISYAMKRPVESIRRSTKSKISVSLDFQSIFFANNNNCIFWLWIYYVCSLLSTMLLLTQRIFVYWCAMCIWYIAEQWKMCCSWSLTLCHTNWIKIACIKHITLQKKVHMRRKTDK